ncbi:MAG: hypothetical protein DHS20C01_34500 [marine bacterium B5-7]|nr:MAG: hypothetical protein DHS20C01_34500 [marine bacterium B5-7]
MNRKIQKSKPRISLLVIGMLASSLPVPSLVTADPPKQQSVTNQKSLAPAGVRKVRRAQTSDGDVHCYESPNKVINDDSVWYEVPCDK